ncbi:MAG TPA: hypothetical protein VGR41_02150 [Actinomycetota bacterium]|jgi:hypothetical protein|nr:hypothetical protein [Actinomycetota bacterium]
MRRAAPAAAGLLLVFSACASVVGPSAPLPSTAEPSPAQGAQDAAARDAAIRFIRAYAGAPNDGGEALTGLADGLAKEWAHWVSVQNNAFDGTIHGVASILSVGAPQPLNGSTFPGLVVEVQATVAFTLAPADGSVIAPQVRSLDGPMSLTQVGPYDWRVADFTRDGQALHSFFVSLSGPGTVEADVTVGVHAVVLTAGAWQIGIDVQNDGSEAIALDAANVALFLDQELVPGNTGSTFEPIAAGATAEGFVTLPAPTTAGRPVVVLRFGTTGDSIDFVISIPDPREAAGQAVPTESASPSPTGALAG